MDVKYVMQVNNDVEDVDGVQTVVDVGDGEIRYPKLLDDENHASYIHLVDFLALTTMKKT